MIEEDFISELRFAKVMGLPTEGLSSRWDKTMVTAQEAEEFCRRRTEQEILRISEDDSEDILVPAVQIAALQQRPWRLPTSEEWEADFKAATYQHFLYGWTSTTEDGLRVVRGGSWLNEPGDARASNRNDFDPGRRFVNVGFRCAR